MELFLDIETIPTQRPGALEEIRATIEPPGNLKKAETIERWMQENAKSKADELWRKTALDGTQGEICTIGFAVGDAEPMATTRASVHVSEADHLQDSFDMMAQRLKNKTPQLIGHNVIAFDLRFIFQRAVILGVKPPFQLPVDRRYNDDRVFDTMTAWAGWGNRISLKNLCRALGIEVKSDGIDGSMVWDLFCNGEASRISGYCKEDVAAVRQVFRRMQFVKQAA